MSKPWHKKDPQLLDEIRADLAEHYPNLHLHISGNRVDVRGSFPVTSTNGIVLDRYSISIGLPSSYPKTLPVVRELGGRIPWHGDFHVEKDGKACVLLPDARWKDFPEGAPLLSYLKGPLHNFFLGQSLVAIGEPWPFGQWRHGDDGIYEYYEELLSTGEKDTIIRFLQILGQKKIKKHWTCPCGSKQPIPDCCLARIVDLRTKISPSIARKTLQRLGLRKMARKSRGHK